MAEEEQVARLKRSVDEWNQWRKQNYHVHPSIEIGNINGIRLSSRLLDVRLSNADLSYTDLGSANLSEASLSKANLLGADLTDADLTDADLGSAGCVAKNKLTCYSEEKRMAEESSWQSRIRSNGVISRST